MVQVSSLHKGRSVLNSSESHHSGSMFDNIQDYVVSISEIIKNVISSTSHEKTPYSQRSYIKQGHLYLEKSFNHIHLEIDFDENLY